VYRLGANITGLRSAIAGWWLQSVRIGEVEVLDAPVDLRQPLTDGIAVFTDTASEVSGRVNADGIPIGGIFVVAFSVDRSAWFFGSRRVASVTTDREGHYVVHNLPPGEYRIVATHDIDAGSVGDPAELERLLVRATPLTIAGTESHRVDLTPR
jgi:hypothetical protein